MQSTGQSSGSSSGQAWQAPLEVDPAEVGEQARELLDDDTDPEAPVGAGPRAADLDLGLGLVPEADLAEQLADVPFDDDGDR